MAKLKASSLVEATMALSILTIVMSVAWICIEQVLHNTDQAQKLHATLLLDQHASNVKKQHLFYNTQWDSLGYRIEQSVVSIEDCTRCYLLTLKCITPGNLLIEKTFILKE